MTVRALLVALSLACAASPTAAGHHSWGPYSQHRIDLGVFFGTVLPQHRAWLEATPPDPRDAPSAEQHPLRANLAGADLRGMDLSETDFRFANLKGADLRGANLARAMLDGAHLDAADLTGANLRETSLKGAKLVSARLVGADFRGADLTGADLSKADLTKGDLTPFEYRDQAGQQLWVPTKLDGAVLRYVDLGEANLTNVSLKGAELSDVDMRQAVFQPKADWEPKIDEVRTWANLETMSYGTSPLALVRVRNILQRNGLRDEERRVTHAIWRTKRKQADFPEDMFLRVLFELPSGYGLEPGRPLRFLFWLFVICGLVYLVPILYVPENPERQPGIFREWAKDRVRRDFGSDKPERLSEGGWRALPYAFYFSLLSAFHIGWRDLNVGNWIARVQPREYALRATGWVRVVSGLQSLVSVYLLALWALTYFGSPFE